MNDKATESDLKHLRILHAYSGAKGHMIAGKKEDKERFERLQYSGYVRPILDQEKPRITRWMWELTEAGMDYLVREIANHNMSKFLSMGTPNKQGGSMTGRITRLLPDTQELPHPGSTVVEKFKTEDGHDGVRVSQVGPNLQQVRKPSMIDEDEDGNTIPKAQRGGTFKRGGGNGSVVVVSDMHIDDTSEDRLRIQEEMRDMARRQPGARLKQ